MWGFVLRVWGFLRTLWGFLGGLGAFWGSLGLAGRLRLSKAVKAFRAFDGFVWIFRGFSRASLSPKPVRDPDIVVTSLGRGPLKIGVGLWGSFKRFL